jgi:prepilin-type N-terminal cleavage/methylation domain-containing protein
MKTFVKSRRSAFSLIEMLMVIAIISVMAALVISAFSNASADARDVMARQQQATIQSAVQNWISQKVTGNSTVAAAKSLYNFNVAGTKRSAMERLELIKDYLDSGTYDHFVSYTTDATKVRSASMKKIKKYIVLSDWPDVTATNKAPYPKVELFSE